MLLSNKILRIAKTVAPKVGLVLVALVVAFAVWRMWFRKEHYSKFKARQWNWTANKYKCASGWKDTGKDKPDDSKGPYLGTSWQGDRSSRHCEQIKSTRFSDMIWDEDKFVCPPGYQETGKSGERACIKKDYDDVDAGCSKDYPVRGQLTNTKGKCCVAKYSQRCKGEKTSESVAKSGCPSEFPVRGKKDSNKDRCCKGAYSDICEGAAPAWSESGSHAKYPYWGWGANKGLRCKYDNNTGCETRWEGGKLKDKKPEKKKTGEYCTGGDQCQSGLCSATKKCYDKPDQGSKRNLNTGEYCTGGNQCKSGLCGSNKRCYDKPTAPTPAATVDILRVYPHWGLKGTKNEGLRCKFNNNTGCTTKWVGGKLVEA